MKAVNGRLKTAVASGNNLLILSGGGYDGSAYPTSRGAFNVVADDAFTGVSTPTRLTFSTTPTKSSSCTVSPD